MYTLTRLFLQFLTGSFKLCTMSFIQFDPEQYESSEDVVTVETQVTRVAWRILASFGHPVEVDVDFSEPDKPDAVVT